MFNASNYSTIYVSQKTGSDLNSGVLPFDDDRSMGPVKKLSRHVTSLPSLSKRSHKCEPRNPAPPVTSIFLPIVGCVIDG